MRRNTFKMINLPGNILFLLPMYVLGEYGDVMIADEVDDRSERLDSNRGGAPYYDRGGWEVIVDNNNEEETEEQLYDHEFLDDDYYFQNMESESYSENFIQSPKDKYAAYRTRPEFQNKSPRYSVIQPYFQQTPNLISRNHYSSKTNRPFEESVNYSDKQYLAPLKKNDETQSDKNVPSQAPGILLFVINLLDSALQSRKSKIQNRFEFERYPKVTLGERVTIDTVSAVQELMLKFLEWGAFIATDLLFQLFWPV